MRTLSIVFGLTLTLGLTITPNHASASVVPTESVANASITPELACAAAYLSEDPDAAAGCWDKVGGTLVMGAACAGAFAGAVAAWSSGWGILATYALIKGVQAVCIGSFVMLAATIAACVDGQDEDAEQPDLAHLEKGLKAAMAEMALVAS